ncbi:MAG: alpha-ketoacid dehydrogenase subunit beta, partial [Fimbriimonadaceae bacterium]
MASLIDGVSSTKKNYLTAIKEAIAEEMARNPHMIAMGEDIGILGGAFGVTDGLQARFGPERVIDMPISEGAIVGTACGMALNGKTVMVEMQFIDFISCGFDQIVNMTATYHYRTAGEVNIPMVIRGPAGGYGGGALYHSQMNEAWFANSPGLKIVCPSTPSDAKGLLISALRDPNPVLFYEIKELYRKREIEEELNAGDDAIVPLGKARIAREGADVTLVTYGQNVWHCLEAADNLAKEGYSAEVIDIRTLVPLDEETIIASLQKTNRVVVVNEAP